MVDFQKDEEVAVLPVPDRGGRAYLSTIKRITSKSYIIALGDHWKFDREHGIQGGYNSCRIVPVTDEIRDRVARQNAIEHIRWYVEKAQLLPQLSTEVLVQIAEMMKAGEE